MKFQLELDFKSTEKISYHDHIFLTGSCFAENIGEKFRAAKFHSTVNPYGILFNPHSIAVSLNDIMNRRTYSDAELVADAHLWHSLGHHGCFSSPDKHLTIEKINAQIIAAHATLKKKGWLIVTFGSSFAWKYKKTGEIVANCHKLPGSEFEKVFLSSDVTCGQWKKLIAELKQFNPQLKILFTVSPVRYIRDGIIENSKSKSALITAVHELCGASDAIYFPAYEYVVDVLRDYRFFKEDMVHPTQQAIDFVWEKFSTSLLDDASKLILNEVIKLNSFASHSPIHSKEEHLLRIKEQCSVLSKKYPFLNWETTP
jgi:hypothetical protein